MEQWYDGRTGEGIRQAMTRRGNPGLVQWEPHVKCSEGPEALAIWQNEADTD